MSDTQNDSAGLEDQKKVAPGSGGGFGGRASLYAGVAGVVLVLVLVNALAGSLLRSVRVDLTQEKLYSLSPAVGPWLQSLDEPLRLDLFISREALTDFPTLRSYATRVEEFLEEMQRASGGKLALNVLNPEPFSEAEDQARSAGVEPVPTGQVGQSITFGLVVSNSVDQREVLSFLDPEQEATLEHDLVRLISGLARAEKPRLAVVSSLPLAGGGGAAPAFPGMPPQQATNSFVIYQQLERVFDLQLIDVGEDALPDQLDGLLLAHPVGLSDGLLRSIDRYARAGGRLLVLYDSLVESVNAPAAEEGAGLGPLLAAWGLEVEPGKAVADPVFAQRVQTRDRRSAGGLQVVPLLTWLALTQDAVAEPSLLTRATQLLRGGSMGAVRRADGAPEGLTFTPLLQSSDQAALVDVSRLGRQLDPAGLLRSHQPDGQRYVLAAEVRGVVAQAFTDPAEKASDTETSEEASNVKLGKSASADVAADQEPGEARIVLIADADVVTDPFWIEDGGVFGMQATADNGAFVLGVLEALTGNPVLSELRPRSASRRPFTRIQDIQRAAEDAYLAEEQRLQDEVSSTEALLQDLLNQAPTDRSTLTLNAEQEADVEKLQEQVLASRKALRGVQYQLRSDIEQMGNRLMVLNVVVWPALVALGAGLSLGLRWRNSRAHR